MLFRRSDGRHSSTTERAQLVYDANCYLSTSSENKLTALGFRDGAIDVYPIKGSVDEKQLVEFMGKKGYRPATQ